MEEISFNLLDDLWIPCRTKTNEYIMLSIKDVLYNSQEILEISSENPLIGISLYRLLLAILHRNFGPKNRDEWINIYKKGEWDKKVLDQYFIKWHHKFELFNEPEHRFYQIELPEITKPTPITKINHVLSSGNNAALFDHTWDSDAVSFDKEYAARLLVAYQNYAVGGGRSNPFNYSHAPMISGIIILIKGKTIFETLMLNLIRYDKNHPFKILDEYGDIPFWERDNKVLCEDKKGRNPNGYLDYLTWQSRRIWLNPYLEDGKIRIKDLYIAQGEKVKDGWNLDPLMVYKQDKKNKLIPVKLRQDRQVWREIEALLRLDLPEKFKAPMAVEWITNLIDIPRYKRFNFEIYGLCNDPSKAAKLLSWHHSTIPLHLEFLQNQGLVNDVKTFIDKCETIVKILNSTIYLFLKDFLYPNTESIGKTQRNTIQDYARTYQVEIKFWNLIENNFYKLIEDLAQESNNLKNRLILIEIQVESVINIAQNILNSLKEEIKERPRALKSFIQNMGYFHKHVHELKMSN